MHLRWLQVTVTLWRSIGASGRRFKRTFRTTPVQAQVQVADPFGNTAPAERTIWYQSRFYRANLHLKGDHFYLRDLTLYRDRFAQPFLQTATRQTEVDQRMPAAIDGYHWGIDTSKASPILAGGHFTVESQMLRSVGEPTVREVGESMEVEVPVEGGRRLHVRFEERRIRAWLTPRSEQATLELAMHWSVRKAPRLDVQPKRVTYHRPDGEYSVDLETGQAERTAAGWNVANDGEPIVLRLG